MSLRVVCVCVRERDNAFVKDGNYIGAEAASNDSVMCVCVCGRDKEREREATRSSKMAIISMPTKSTKSLK